MKNVERHTDRPALAKEDQARLEAYREERQAKEDARDLKRIERREKVENAKAATVGFLGGAVVAGQSKFGAIKDNITNRWEAFKLNRAAKRIEREENGGRTTGRRAAIAGLVAAPLLLVGAYGANHGWFNGAETKNDTASAASDTMNTDELRKNLTVKTVDQNCVAIVKGNGGKAFNYNGSEYVKFDVASTEPVVSDKESQTSRLWSDAVSNPIENKDNIHFIIVGDGKEKVNIVNSAKNSTIENITFIPQIPKRQVQSMIDFFDVCYIGWQKHKMYELGIAAQKLPEYLYSAKPIIHSYSGNGDFVAQAKAGITIEAENPFAIAKAIDDIYEMTIEQRNMMGQNGREFALNNFDYAKIAKKLSTILFEA